MPAAGQAALENLENVRFQPPATKRAQERGEGAAGPEVRGAAQGRCPRHLRPPQPAGLSPGKAGPRGTEREFPAEQTGFDPWVLLQFCPCVWGTSQPTG